MLGIWNSKENIKIKKNYIEDGRFAVVYLIGVINIISIPQWKKQSHPTYVRKPKSLKNLYCERFVKVELGREGLFDTKIL